MPARSNSHCSAFTLVELILVMALLVVFLAISAPTIARSFTRNELNQEATRLLALTEYSRNEAVSQGVPMEVWIDSQSRSYGVQGASRTGGASRTESASRTGGQSEKAGLSREKTYRLAPGMRFDLGQAPVGRNGLVILTELAPDGTPDVSSLQSVKILDRNNAAITLRLTPDGWGYEIGNE